MIKPDCKGGCGAKNVNFSLALCFVLLCELAAAVFKSVFKF